MKPIKIISGGQTGADQGALYAARELGIETGGWAPRGFKTERGYERELLSGFGLVEHPVDGYKPRTSSNILTSDATLIVATDLNSTGTKLTVKQCKKFGRPFLIHTRSCDNDVFMAKDFLNVHQPKILNVAGNRESVSPRLQEYTTWLLLEVLK